MSAKRDNRVPFEEFPFYIAKLWDARLTRIREPCFRFLPLLPFFLSFFLSFENWSIDATNNRKCAQGFFSIFHGEIRSSTESRVSLYVQEELAGGELEKDGRSKDNGLQPSPPSSSREGDFRIHVTSPIIAITANQSWGIPRFNVSREKSTAIYS